MRAFSRNESESSASLSGYEDGLPFPLRVLLDAVLYGSHPPARTWMLERYEIVALPGADLTGRMRRGDLVLRGGEGSFAQPFLIADPAVRSHHDVLGQAGRPEICAPGGFVYIVENGFCPRTEEDRFARRVTDQHGRCRRNQVVLRPRESAGGDGERLDATSLMMGMTLANLSSRPAVKVEVTTPPAEPKSVLDDADGESVLSAGWPVPEDVGSPSGSRWRSLVPGAQQTLAETLLDGRKAFEAIAQAIRTATQVGHFVYILGWMIDIDVPLVGADATTSLLALLSKAMSKGVQVRILVWDNLDATYSKMTKANIQRLRAAAGQTGNFLAIHEDSSNYTPPKSASLIKALAPTIQELLSYRKYIPERFLPDPYWLERAAEFAQSSHPHSIAAHHEKVTLVHGQDGLIGFCGGIDYNCNRITDNCNDKTPHAPVPAVPSVHDVACRLQGPAVAAMLDKFRLRWHNNPEAKEKLIDPPATAMALPSGRGAACWARIVGTYNSPDGATRDRSLKQTYLKVIGAARRHIYIEDQYGVNLEVARMLNARLRDPEFESLIIVLQDASKTSDILIPNARRAMFKQVLFDGLTDTQKNKAAIAIYDAAKASAEHLHSGMHAKTLIVDDEIAIIGSANVNQRSFTCDSETCVVLIDDEESRSSHVRAFRLDTFREHAGRNMKREVWEDWSRFAAYIQVSVASFPPLLNLRKFDRTDADDIDVRLRHYLSLAAQGSSALLMLGGLVPIIVGNQLPSAFLAALKAMPKVIEELWDLIIDPNVDAQ